MSIFDLFRKDPVSSTRGGGLRRTWSQAPRSETQRLPALYHQSPRLDPVELIASTIANSPMELFDKAKLRKDADNAEPLYDHAFYQLMETPSQMFPELDGHAVKKVTVVLVELLGECFWLKLRSRRKVTDILPFPPAWCIRTPTASDATFLFQPFGTTAGKTIEVDAADVVWFKQADMFDPYGRGRGRTEAMGDELDTDEMAAKWQKNYFYNDATPPFWANLPGAQPMDLERMKDSWGMKLGGWLNARKPAFTNAEGMTITKLGDTVREMDFTETRKGLRDAFLQHYSIPPELFGIIENSNRSTIDAAYYLFAKNVIQRRLGFYERTITRQLINVDYDVRLEMKIKFEVPADETFRLQVVNEGVARGILTRADWKKAMGYPVEKGDDVYIMSYSQIEVPKGQTIADVAPEEATIYLADEPTDETIPIPENVASTAMNGAQVASLVQVAQAVADGLLPYETALEIILSAYPNISREDAVRMLKPLINFEPDTPVELPNVVEEKPEEAFKGAKPIDAQKAAHWKTFDSRAKEGEGMFRSSVRKYAEAQSKRLKASMSDSKKYKAAVDAAFRGADEALMHALAPAWLASMTDGAHIGRDLLGLKVSPSFALYNKAFDAWIKKHGLEKAKEINTTTYKKLMEDMTAEMATGVEAGESMEHIADRLVSAAEGIYENMSVARANMIAITETASSVNFGQFTVYREESIEKKEWLATLDSDTRDAHAEADGQIVGIDEPFIVGGEQLMYPGDPNGSPGNVIYERCTILPVIDR